MIIIFWIYSSNTAELISEKHAHVTVFWSDKELFFFKEREDVNSRSARPSKSYTCWVCLNEKNSHRNSSVRAINQLPPRYCHK